MNLPRSAELWLPGYVRDRSRRWLDRSSPKRLWVAITDHYEPLGGKVSQATAVERVERWQRMWPEIAERAPRDSAGRRPCYSFFYPQEEYVPELLEPLAEMTRAGVGDVEVHLHHDRETADGFRAKVTEFCRQLRDDHGLLRERGGRTVFGFIHGNWALDNSRPDGRLCGLTGEIGILRELGCYADFTMPSCPSPTQGRIVNQIYWSTGPLDRPRSFDQGTEATPGGGERGAMLMITGPLGLRFRGRLTPRMETGEIAVYDPPTADRVKLWLALAPRLGEDAFLKLYTHGAREDNAAALLGSGLGSGGGEGGLLRMYGWLAELAAERGMEVRWVSAFEMFQAVEAITGAGVDGTPGVKRAEQDHAVLAPGGGR